MQRKIAIPVDVNGRLDGHFGHCKFFSLVQTEGNKVLASVKVQPPPHEPGVLPAWLAQQGVSDVIAGGMGQRAIELFQAAGVNVFVGAPQLEELPLRLSWKWPRPVCPCWANFRSTGRWWRLCWKV